MSVLRRLARSGVGGAVAARPPIQPTFLPLGGGDVVGGSDGDVDGDPFGGRLRPSAEPSSDQVTGPARRTPVRPSPDASAIAPRSRSGHDASAPDRAGYPPARPAPRVAAADAGRLGATTTGDGSGDAVSTDIPDVSPAPASAAAAVRPAPPTPLLSPPAAPVSDRTSAGESSEESDEATKARTVEIRSTPERDDLAARIVPRAVPQARGTDSRRMPSDHPTGATTPSDGVRDRADAGPRRPDVHGPPSDPAPGPVEVRIGTIEIFESEPTTPASGRDVVGFAEYAAVRSYDWGDDG